VNPSTAAPFTGKAAYRNNGTHTIITWTCEGKFTNEFAPAVPSCTVGDVTTTTLLGDIKPGDVG
jgi:hypothetical protein